MYKDRNKNFRFKREKPEFDQQIVDIARVTRVMAGGKRMSFRVCLVIGDRKGRVGVGLAKGADVSIAIGKAYKKAEKNLVKINIVNNTIPHEVRIKRGASKILLKPAPIGTGIIAGGACRTVLSLAGVGNAVAKILGSKNKVNNVRAIVEALISMKKVPETKNTPVPPNKAGATPVPSNELRGTAGQAKKQQAPVPPNAGQEGQKQENKDHDNNSEKEETKK